MATEVEASTPTRELADSKLPYPPSVVDRFMAWADRLPGPVWALYLLLLVTLIVIVNSVAWLDGSQQPGTFDLYRTSLAVYPVGVLALMHYLNRVAKRSLAAFRPALGANDADYARFEYELTTLPGRRTWSVLGLSLLFTGAFTFFIPNLGDAFRRSPWRVVADSAIYLVVFGLVAVYVYHILRQLRMVSLIHAGARNVSLFRLTPLYAFSGLTAQTGIGLLLLNYFSVLTDPTPFVNPPLTVLRVSASLVAVTCFVLPLRGMHQRIAAEKARLRAETNARLEETIQEVLRRAGTQDLRGTYQLSQLMASLVATRELLTKIPTWPWETSTLTGFITAFLLPLVLRLLNVLVERFVGP